jgi:hypothetical protein
MQESIFVKNKNVGSVEGNTFYKICSFNKHHSFALKAWGISEEVVRKLMEMKVENLEIYDKKFKVKWFSTMSNFLTNSFVKSLGNFEPQRFLPDRFWQIKKNESSG